MKSRTSFFGHIVLGPALVAGPCPFLTRIMLRPSWPTQGRIEQNETKQQNLLNPNRPQQSRIGQNETKQQNLLNPSEPRRYRIEQKGSNQAKMLNLRLPQAL